MADDRFVTISRDGRAVGSDPLVDLPQGDVLFTPQGTIKRTSPVSAGMAEEAPAPEPIDPIDFFQRRTPVMDREVFKEDQRRWFREFASQYHDRQFTNLDDYMDFVTDVQDRTGAKLSVEEILPFIQKQALENMPPKIKREYESMLEDRAQDTQWSKQIQRLKEFNDDPENKARGIIMTPEGKIKQVDPNRDFERKQKLVDGLQRRVSDLEKMRPQRKDYRGAEGQIDVKGFSEDMAEWKELYIQERDAYFEALGRKVNEDDATSMGQPGASVEAQQPVQYKEGDTATNPQTGERVVFQGGEWLPL